MKAVLLAVLALVLAAPALACGDSMNAENLVLTPAVRTSLDRALSAANGGAGARLVPGRTYYALHVGIHFAVATVAVPGRATRPAIFTDDGLGKWRLVRVTHGGVCSGVVPIDVIHSWWLVNWRGGCYVEPSA
jgi:hypothetical protein